MPGWRGWTSLSSGAPSCSAASCCAKILTTSTSGTSASSSLTASLSARSRFLQRRLRLWILTRYLAADSSDRLPRRRSAICLMLQLPCWQGAPNSECLQRSCLQSTRKAYQECPSGEKRLHAMQERFSSLCSKSHAVCESTRADC